MDGEKVVRALDDSLVWKNLFTRGLEIISVVGDHLSMIREHNPTLAREMNEVLQRHWPSQHDKVSIEPDEPQQASPGPETGAIVSPGGPDR